jgi:hypothetical protein
MAFTSRIAAIKVAFPPQEGSELVYKPPTPLSDPPGTQPILSDVF